MIPAHTFHFSPRQKTCAVLPNAPAQPNYSMKQTPILHTVSVQRGKTLSFCICCCAGSLLKTEQKINIFVYHALLNVKFLLSIRDLNRHHALGVFSFLDRERRRRIRSVGKSAGTSRWKANVQWIEWLRNRRYYRSCIAGIQTSNQGPKEAIDFIVFGNLSFRTLRDLSIVGM